MMGIVSITDTMILSVSKPPSNIELSKQALVAQWIEQ